MDDGSLAEAMRCYQQRCTVDVSFLTLRAHVLIKVNSHRKDWTELNWQLVILNMSRTSSSSSSSSRNEYYLGGVMALLLQDHRTMLQCQ